MHSPPDVDKTVDAVLGHAPMHKEVQTSDADRRLAEPRWVTAELAASDFVDDDELLCFVGKKPSVYYSGA